MPDNRNGSKFMAMLERKGIVHRTIQDGDSNQSENRNGTQPPISQGEGFGPNSAGEGSPKVTPAARQPIPGMSVVTNNIMSENNNRERDDSPQQSAAGLNVSEPQAWTASSAGFSSSAGFTSSAGLSSSAAQTPYRELPVENPIGSSEAVDFEESSYTSKTPDLTAGYLTIAELFEALSLRANKVDTIYLVEEYIKTLPPSLPDEAKREIVGKIITASGFDYDLLMGDGVLRVKMLKDYAEKFSQRTDDYVAACQNELNELERKAVGIRSMVDDRKELHKKQFMTIEAEAQRLKDILTFLSG